MVLFLNLGREEKKNTEKTCLIAANLPQFAVFFCAIILLKRTSIFNPVLFFCSLNSIPTSPISIKKTKLPSNSHPGEAARSKVGGRAGEVQLPWQDCHFNHQSDGRARARPISPPSVVVVVLRARGCPCTDTCAVCRLTGWAKKEDH